MRIEHSINPLAVDHQNVVLPDPGRSVCVREIIAANALVFSRPVICVVDGNIWGRDDWTCPVPVESDVRFMELPRGDNFGRILGSLLVIAASVWAPYSLFGLMGTGAQALAGAAISIGGSLLMGAIFPVTADVANSAASEKAKTKYALNGSNALSPGQPFPERFGRREFYPNLAQGAYTRYESNDQYLYVLLILGVGEFDDVTLRIENTKFDRYTSSTYNIIAPGDLPSIVTRVCWPCAEVSGQELTTDWITYVVNPAGTEARVIEYDIVFPNGLRSLSQIGNGYTRGCRIVTASRTVDEYGNALTDWRTLHTRTYYRNARSQVAFTNRVSVPPATGPGRYEFRIRRSRKESTSSRHFERCHIGGLRAFGGKHPAVDGVTMLECKIKASKRLNGEVADKINVTATRKLRRVTDTGFGSFAATTSIIDAVAYLYTSDNNGQQPASNIVWDEMAYLRSLFASEGYTFSHAFTSRESVMDACATAARCGMAVPYTPGGMFCLAADRLSTVTTAPFTSHRGIDQGSLTVTQKFKTSSTPDAVRVTYIDPQTWQPATVDCNTSGVEPLTPQELTLDGCTDADHAYAVGMRMWKEIEIPPPTVTWTTGLMGNLPSLFSWLLVGEDSVDWGQTGVIAAVELGVIWTSEPVDFEGEASGALVLQMVDGSMAGPYTVTPTDDPHKVNGAIPDVPTLQDGDVSAVSYIFGPSSDEFMTVRVVGISPSSRDSVSISAEVVIADAYDLTSETPTPESPELPEPWLSSVDVQLAGDEDDPTSYLITWSGLATSYRIEANVGDGYVLLADSYTTEMFIDYVTDATEFSVRVTPYVSGSLQSTLALSAGINLLPAPSGLSAQVDDDGNVDISWADIVGADGYNVSMVVADVVMLSQVVDETSAVFSTEQISAYGGPWAGTIIEVAGVVGGDVGLTAVASIGNATPAPETISIDGDKVYWTMPAGTSVAGWEVLCNFDVTADIETAQVISAGILTVRSFDTSAWSGRARRVWVRSVSANGVRSDSVSITMDTGDIATINVVETVSEAAEGWTGDLAGGSVVSGDLVASATMIYQQTFIVPTAYAGAKLIISADLVSGSLTSMEFVRSDSRQMWGSLPMWGGNAMWATTNESAWQPLPGWLVVAAGETIQIRATFASGSEVNDIVAIYDVDDLSLNLDSVAIAAGGTRITIPASAFRWIKTMTYGLEYVSGGTAVSARHVDKGIIVDDFVDDGPLVQLIDATGASVAGVVDIKIIGAKGI